MEPDYAYCISAMLAETREHAKLLRRTSLYALALLLGGGAALWNPLGWEGLPTVGLALLGFASAGVLLILASALVITRRLDCILRLRKEEGLSEAEQELLEEPE